MSKEIIEDISPINQLVSLVSLVPRLVDKTSLLNVLHEPEGSLTTIVNFTSIVELEEV